MPHSSTTKKFEFSYTGPSSQTKGLFGKLGIKYSGQPFTTNGSFDPVGITTDGQSQILTADFNNDCTHIIDQGGQFFRYLNNCNLRISLFCCHSFTFIIFLIEGKMDMDSFKYKYQYE